MDRYTSNNVLSHVISSFSFDRNSSFGNISSWINRCITYYKLPVVEIIFLSTTNFTFPQALFYNINSLADAFRWSETRQIKLTSCRFSLTAAEHTLSRQCYPSRDYKHTCVAQTFCDKYEKQVLHLRLLLYYTLFPTCRER